MSAVSRLLSLIAVAASLCVLSACGAKAGCGNGFGTAGTSSGTSGTGGGTPTTCGSNTGGGGNTNAVDLLYSTVNTQINGAYYNGSSLLALSGFNSPNFGSGGAVDMLVVGKNFLYQPWAPTPATSNVYGFTIDHKTGALAPITGSPFTTTAIADVLGTDPNGKFLFLGQSSSFGISVMQINASTGALTLTPGSPFPLNGLTAGQIAVDSSGKYLYATVGNLSNGDVLGFSIDQTTGALTALPNSPYFMGVSRVQAVANSSYLIGSGSGRLQVIAINPTTGDLTAGVSVNPVVSPSQVIVHPNGKFAYSLNEASSPIEGFAFDATAGTLTALSGSPFTNAQGINSAKIDTSGTAMVGLTPTTSFGLVVVDPTTGTITSPGNPTVGPGSNYFALTN